MENRLENLSITDLESLLAYTNGRFRLVGENPSDEVLELQKKIVIELEKRLSNLIANN